MSTTAARAIGFAAVLLVAIAGVGCDQLDGRNRNRKGNRLFQDKQFVDAAAEYEKALTEVDDPIIHYNLGLTYSKVYKVGAEEGAKILIDVQGSFACSAIPNVSTLERQVCVKEGDKHFDDCDDKHVCASSYTCQKLALCAVDNNALVELSAQHFQKWLASHPEDRETRGIMTQGWLDSSQYPKAIEYWTGLLAQKQNDPDIMGALAGISQKAGDWRASFKWYNKVAEASPDVFAKVTAYQSIGNVAWSKLNSRTLTGPDTIELADRAIAALQKAAALQPENPRPVGLSASIFNFRALAMGASWAAGLDRASAKDLQDKSAVLRQKAKKAQGQATPSPAAPPSGATANSNPAKTGG
jgi:tetratricopeptide (TPR) repeat protein